MEFLLQLVINGLVVGCIYSLVALGFVIIYKSSGILNFAQGEFLLLGAYVFLAIVAQGERAGGAGAAAHLRVLDLARARLERAVLRPLIGEPIISVIMVTLGLSSILRAIVQGIWGTDNAPDACGVLARADPDRPPAGRPRLPLQRGVCRGAARRPHPLLQVRAPGHRHARHGRLSASLALHGISVRRIFALSWSIAAVVSAAGGVLLATMRGGVDGSLAILGLKCSRW